jgi:hypothetical protein
VCYSRAEDVDTLCVSEDGIKRQSFSAYAYFYLKGNFNVEF